MYEACDKETKQLVRVTLQELEQGLASGKLVSSLEQVEAKAPRKTRIKAADDENQG
jgi:hypothetical protein